MNQKTYEFTLNSIIKLIDNIESNKKELNNHSKIIKLLDNEYPLLSENRINAIVCLLENKGKNHSLLTDTIHNQYLKLENLCVLTDIEFDIFDKDNIDLMGLRDIVIKDLNGKPIKKLYKPKGLNKKQTQKELNLSNNVINSLIEIGKLDCERNGKECLISYESIERFKKEFDRKNYLTISETKTVLEKNEFYEIFNPLIKQTDRKGKFPYTVIHFIENDFLKSKKFGKTVFVSKKSLTKCISKLREIHKPIETLIKKSTKGISSNKGKSTIRKKPTFGKRKIPKVA